MGAVQIRSRSQGNLPRYPTTLLFQASFDPKMARIRVLQQAQALYVRQNSIAVGITRQQVLSPALSVTRRPIATTASLLQQKEPEAPVEVEAAPATVEKRKHVTVLQRINWPRRSQSIWLQKKSLAKLKPTMLLLLTYWSRKNNAIRIPLTNWH